MARAWTGLASAYAALAEMDGYPDGLQASREAAARKAVELDPAYAAAHAELATFYMDSGEPDRARAEFNKALDLNPGPPTCWRSTPAGPPTSASRSKASKRPIARSD